MHDAKGRELKEGFNVLIPARITSLQAGEEYCNVSVESLYGRRPDGAKENISAINTGVLLRFEDGDELSSADLMGFTGATAKTEAAPDTAPTADAPATGAPDPVPVAAVSCETAPPTAADRLARIRAEVDALTADLLVDAKKEGRAVEVHLLLAVEGLEHLVKNVEIVLGLGE